MVRLNSVHASERGLLLTFSWVYFLLLLQISLRILRPSQLDANPSTERCLRARGKIDIVFGILVYGLATMPYIQALVNACLAWFLSSLYTDFAIATRDRFRSDVFAQLAIASVSAAVLLLA